MKHLLGILGGMGAAAGVHFAQMLIQEAQKRGAKHDDEFPHFMLYNLPLSGMSENGVDDPVMVSNFVGAGLTRLKLAGCDKFLIACNSVHTPKITECTEDLVNMPFLAIKAALLKAQGPVGVLCSESCKRDRIYDGFPIIQTTADEQIKINEAIGAVMAGDHNGKDFLEVGRVMKAMEARGAKAILVGCTELPICVREEWVSIPVIDAGRLAVQHALDLMGHA